MRKKTENQVLNVISFEAEFVLKRFLIFGGSCSYEARKRTVGFTYTFFDPSLSFLRKTENKAENFLNVFLTFPLYSTGIMKFEHYFL